MWLSLNIYKILLKAAFGNVEPPSRFVTIYERPPLRNAMIYEETYPFSQDIGKYKSMYEYKGYFGSVSQKTT